MHFTKQLLRKISIMICFALVIAMIPVSEAKADTGVIAVTQLGGSISMTTGEEVQMQADASVQYNGQTYTVSRYEFTSDNSVVASVDMTGKVTAQRFGAAQITVAVYTTQVVYDYTTDDYENIYYDSYYYDYFQPEYGGEYLLFQAYYEVTVFPDLSDVKIDKTSQTGYASSSWDVPSYTFQLTSKEVLSEDWDAVTLSCVSSNSGIYLYSSLQNNVLTIQPSAPGKTVVTVSINGQKLFKLTINTIQVKISANSALLTVKETKQLSIQGYKGAKVKWSSGNPAVVSVSAKGVIKAKKIGNAVIKAEVGNFTFGCAVSVVTPGKKRTINTAIHIAKTCTYSQPKRMQSKFYDCSSLVWRSYSKNGVNFGNKSYAPVAASIGQWCAQKKKLVKGGLSQTNLNKMKLNAGDLMFETGADNGRYKGIYHVEMIVGYVCQGFDQNGKPILQVKWANRPDGCYGCGGQMVGRP